MMRHSKPEICVFNESKLFSLGNGFKQFQQIGRAQTLLKRAFVHGNFLEIQYTIVESEKKDNRISKNIYLKYFGIFIFAR